jgi:hypothetical protein
MDSSEKTSDKWNLNAVALELFKARSMHPGTTPQQLAITCFRDAQAFLKVTDQLVAGEIELVNSDANPLDVAFAPNLKRTHPINLMSREWGDIAKVQTALTDLDANPAADTYEPYSWGKPEVNQARALFPAVVQRSQLLSKVQ